MRFDITEFIKESNAIESVFTMQAVEESLNAWRYLETIKELNKPVIKKVHALIMESLRPDIAGHFRKVNVRVGNNIKLPWTQVISSLDSLLTFKPYNALSCLEWHIQFEDIHPFADGNGRTGRLIYAKQCVDLKLTPLIFREKDKWGYYDFWRKL